MVASQKITQIMQNYYNDEFPGIWCLKGTFSLHTKDNAKPYLVPPRYEAYVLHEPFRKELVGLQDQQDISTTRGQ